MIDEEISHTSVFFQHDFEKIVFRFGSEFEGAFGGTCDLHTTPIVTIDAAVSNPTAVPGKF
jgi:hypothetical protein